MRKLLIYAAGLMTAPILGALGAWVYFGQGRFDIAATSSVSESEERAAVFVREKGLTKQFHPIVNDAIAEFNAEWKKVVSLL